jgi:hypothetical protein
MSPVRPVVIEFFEQRLEASNRVPWHLAGELNEGRREQSFTYQARECDIVNHLAPASRWWH